MMVGQGNEEITMTPMSELPHPSIDQYADYCATIWEQVLAGKMSHEQAATLMFDEEPSYTFVKTA